MSLHIRFRRIAAFGLLASALAACGGGDGPSTPPPPLVVTATGTLERGEIVTLAASRSGQSVPAGDVTWTVVPSTAGQVLAGGQVRLLASGIVQINGAYDGSTGSTQLQVTEPPGALVITTLGRLERGQTVTLSAARDGQPVPVGGVTWTVTPAAAAEVRAGGQLKLLAAGTVQVSASYDRSTGAVPLTIAMPPTIVFDMSVGGNRDIYSVSLDGGELTRLTDDPASDSDPSAAAGKVLFSSFRAGGGFPELYILPVTGGAATRVTTTARAETAPALSPDGLRIAYAYDVSGVSRIWTANVNGTGAAAYTGSLGFAGSPETSPSWAPAGSRLAFVGTAEGQADIWDLVAGGTAAILAGGEPADVDPAWSPDGTLVAFASTREVDPAIFTVRVSDRQITRLSSRAGSEAEPSWTADGRLVYVEFTSSTVTRLVWIDPAAPGTVYEIPVAGGAPRRPSVVR